MCFFSFKPLRFHIKGLVLNIIILFFADLCDHACGGKLGMGLSLAVAGILFPLIVWGGYELLPFDLPLVDTAPLRVIYTLRCAFFAIIPILLGKALF